jgi:hypothetical protein
MKEIIIIVGVVSITVAAILFAEPAPRATVVMPEVQKTSDYKRPVREGNCWRQFVGRGDTDSILVCH